MAVSRMFTIPQIMTYEELGEEIIKDIRKLFLSQQIREDGQVKRNPGVYTPWAARNTKYSELDRQRMKPLVDRVAKLNEKNIWQFMHTDFRVIASLIREEARRLDKEIAEAALPN